MSHKEMLMKLDEDGTLEQEGYSALVPLGHAAAL